MNEIISRIHSGERSSRIVASSPNVRIMYFIPWLLPVFSCPRRHPFNHGRSRHPDLDIAGPAKTVIASASNAGSRRAERKPMASPIQPITTGPITAPT